MACHGSHDPSTSTSTSTSPPSGHGMGRMGLLMALCCLAPLAAILAIGVFGIPGSSVLYFAAALLCPLMMVFMMRGMGHDHGGTTADAAPTPAARDPRRAD